MSAEYYDHVRSEIAPLLPARATRIVDVGCGSGATLAWLRTLYPEAHTIGLEGNGALRDRLAMNADEALILDLTGEIPPLGAPDLMLFLDVLEHLPDPGAALRRMTAGLAAGGAIIVSVPNVAHLSVSLPLLIKGEFTYRDAGILDRTHLRFFTRKTALALLSEAGFSVDRTTEPGMGPKTKLADRLTLGRLRTRLSKQIIMRGVRA